MSLVPLVALAIFLVPFVAAHLVRAFLPAATARVVGHAFQAVSWVAWTVCAALGVYCLYAMGHNPTAWSQLGVFGLIGYVMMGSAIWTAFHLAYRVLVPANRFTRYAGVPVEIQGWPAE
jgi:hypothetical protein